MTDQNVTEVINYKIRPLMEAIAVGVSVFLGILITSYFIYDYSLQALKGEIKEGLSRTGSVMVGLLDGDIHKTFVSPNQESSKDYLDTIEPLAKVLASDPTIAFVYTTVLIDDKVHFILDATAPGDADGDGIDDKAHIMEEYAEASPELIQALKNQTMTMSEEPYQDRWGSFVSAYLPFYDKQGQFVGVVGIDIDSTNYFARLEPIKRSTQRAMVTGFFTAYIVGTIVWFLRNFIRILHIKRLKLVQTLQANQESGNSRGH